MGHGRRHAAVRRGSSAVVGRRGVAGSGPTAVLTGGARLALKQGRARADRWAPLQSQAAAV
jgi:hypothetical protein